MAFRSIRAGALACLALIVVCLCAGCAGIVPLAAHVRTPEDTEIAGKVDRKFIAPGTTTRAEVLEHLQDEEAGVEGDRYFLARWQSSRAGGWYFLCGSSTCLGNAGRIWATTNALVEFDDRQIVTRYAMFGDMDIVARLGAMAAQEKPRSFDPPQQIQADHVEDDGHTITLTLANDMLSAHELVFHHGLGRTTTKDRDFAIPRAAVQSVRFRPGAEFPSVLVNVRFREKTAIGRAMTVRLNAAELFALLEFVDQRP